MRPLFLFEGSSSSNWFWFCRSADRPIGSTTTIIPLERQCDAIRFNDTAPTLPSALLRCGTNHDTKRPIHGRALLHIDSDILLNAAAYLFCCLRRDVFHETSKGWISIQDTRPHVSGMQTRETLSHSKLCDFIFQKIWWALASLSWVDKRHESSVRIGNVQGKQ